MPQKPRNDPPPLLSTNLHAPPPTPPQTPIHQDATYKYYEVILVDPAHKAIRRDARVNWIVNPVHKHRELRGLTSSGRSSRGLRKRGHRAHNIIGSSAHGSWKRRNTLSLRRYR
jgi:large subunit ribosomal protein L15e